MTDLKQRQSDVEVADMWVNSHLCDATCALVLRVIARDPVIVEVFEVTATRSKISSWYSGEAEPCSDEVEL